MRPHASDMASARSSSLRLCPMALTPSRCVQQSLKLHGVYLEGAVLKPNMVKNGIDGPRVPPPVVAQYTIQALMRTVPPAMPGIFFLSGETALDEDNEETATNNLNAMHVLYPRLPWHVSFSYGKALQKTCIVTWMGKDENVAKALATPRPPRSRTPPRTAQRTVQCCTHLLGWASTSRVSSCTGRRSFSLTRRVTRWSTSSTETA